MFVRSVWAFQARYRDHRRTPSVTRYRDDSGKILGRSALRPCSAQVSPSVSAERFLVPQRRSRWRWSHPAFDEPCGTAAHSQVRSQANHHIQDSRLADRASRHVLTTSAVRLPRLHPLDAARTAPDVAPGPYQPQPSTEQSETTHSPAPTKGPWVAPAPAVHRARPVCTRTVGRRLLVTQRSHARRREVDLHFTVLL